MSNELPITPASKPVAVGQVRLVPLRLSTNTLMVPCLVADTRAIFGRTEFQVTPVSGEGYAWVQEVNLGEGGAVMVNNEKFQTRHTKAGKHEATT